MIRFLQLFESREPFVSQAAMVKVHVPDPPSIPAGMELLDPKDRHITIFARKKLTDEQRQKLAAAIPQLPPVPLPAFGQPFVAVRPEKRSQVLPIGNQKDFQDFQQAWADAAGIENIEADRFFHATVANIHGGNPMKSVGDVTRADMQGHDLIGESDDGPLDFSTFWNKVGGKVCTLCNSPEGHTSDCPQRWADETRECMNCGEEYVPEYRMQWHCCTNCAQADGMLRDTA